MKTAEKIKLLRNKKGLSQEELGNLVGVQKAAINKYETGRVVNIKKSMLQKLADALEVSPADLLDDAKEDLVLVPMELDLFGVDDQSKAILDLLSRMTDAEKQELLDYMKYLISKRKDT